VARNEAHSVADMSSIVLLRTGEVVSTTDPTLPWHIAKLDQDHDVVLIDDFLRELAANDCSAQTLRSYSFDLLRWWRFLDARGHRWDVATRTDTRDLVLWMRQARTKGYRPATINHALSVLSVFYEHQARLGAGPVINPVPAGGPGMRRYAHHNPMEEYQPRPRRPYRQRVVDSPPRALPEDLIDRVFASLRSNRDRALIALYLSTGVRANELLGMTGRDVDWGNQAIGVISKGTRAYQWVPASPDALTWLRLYLNNRPPAPLGERLWWTLREPRCPLEYSAVRALLRRINKALGTGITLHDFRHTCATRLANDPSIPITDVQAVLRHVHLSTTSRYIRPQTQDMISRVREHHLRPKPITTADSGSWNYDATDMAELFGGTH
jgi:integrase/recombinase XerD